MINNLIKVLFILSITLLLSFSLDTPSTFIDRKDRPLIIAHRGASGYFPGDTLTSIKIAN